LLICSLTLFYCPVFCIAGYFQTRKTPDKLSIPLRKKGETVRQETPERKAYYGQKNDNPGIHPQIRMYIFNHRPGFDSAQPDSHPERSPNFIGHNVKMTENNNNAVISTSLRGEISSNIQISLPKPWDRDDKKLKICHW
jgi:hypothetical protein